MSRISFPGRSLPALVVLLTFPGATALAQAREVSYVKDVKPFLTKYCVECHTKAKAQGGVSLETYQDLVRGNDPVMRPKQPDKSDLVKVLAAAAGRKLMPPRKATARPSADEIAMIRAWVLAGGRDDSEDDKKDPQSRLMEQVDPFVILEARR